MWLPWICVAGLFGIAVFLGTKVLAGIRTGSLLDPDKKRNEHIHRADRPLAFWGGILAVGAGTLAFLVFAIATAGGALGFWEPLV